MLAVFFVSAKTIESHIRMLLPTRQELDISNLLAMLQICSSTYFNFIGAFELFASTPDFADPTANFNRICQGSSDKLIATTEKSTAGGTYGDGLLPLVVVSTVCRMLLL